MSCLSSASTAACLLDRILAAAANVFASKAGTTMNVRSSAIASSCWNLRSVNVHHLEPSTFKGIPLEMHQYIQYVPKISETSLAVSMISDRSLKD
jgi:hypothetical protein